MERTAQIQEYKKDLDTIASGLIPKRSADINIDELIQHLKWAGDEYNDWTKQSSRDIIDRIQQLRKEVGGDDENFQFIAMTMIMKVSNYINDEFQ